MKESSSLVISLQSIELKGDFIQGSWASYNKEHLAWQFISELTFRKNHIYAQSYLMMPLFITIHRVP